MMSWCLMSSDVIWHIRDKLWPMPKHGSVILYVSRKPEGSLGRTAQDVHLDSHTAPELWFMCVCVCVCVCVEPIIGLEGCLALNKNWFCLMPVLACVIECAWNVGCICHWGASFREDVPLVEFMFPLFTCMPDNYCRQLRSLLFCLCQCVMSFQCYLINSFVCCFLLSLTRGHICCWDEFKSSSLTLVMSGYVIPPTILTCLWIHNYALLNFITIMRKTCFPVLFLFLNLCNKKKKKLSQCTCRKHF